MLLVDVCIWIIFDLKLIKFQITQATLNTLEPLFLTFSEDPVLFGTAKAFWSTVILDDVQLCDGLSISEAAGVQVMTRYSEWIRQIETGTVEDELGNQASDVAVNIMGIVLNSFFSSHLLTQVFWQHCEEGDGGWNVMFQTTEMFWMDG